MVYHTISNSSSTAPSASSRIKVLKQTSRFPVSCGSADCRNAGQLRRAATAPHARTAAAAAHRPALPLPGTVTDGAPIGPAIERARSRWCRCAGPLPELEQDNTTEAWNAWIKSCERPGPTFAPLCSEVRRLSLGTPDEQRQWMKARLQPYRVEALGAPAEGLLTSWPREPMFDASRSARRLWRAAVQAARRRRSASAVHAAGDGDAARARAQLAGSEIAYLAKPGGCADFADPGLGPHARDRADDTSAWCGWPLPPPTTSPTAAPANG